MSFRLGRRTGNMPVAKLALILALGLTAACGDAQDDRRAEGTAAVCGEEWQVAEGAPRVQPSADGVQVRVGVVSRGSKDGPTESVEFGIRGALRSGASFAPGMVGQAFCFDGIDDFVELVDTRSLDFGGGDFTVGLWATIDSLATDQTFLHKILGKPPEDQAVYLGWSSHDQSLRFIVREGESNQNDLVISASIEPHRWYHIAAVRSGDSSTVYINGTPIGSQSAGANVDTGSGGLVRIGNDIAIEDLESRPFKGRIDEVQLFDHALSPAELGAIYDSGKAAITAVSAGVSHFCSLSAGGALQCWGRNDHGQFGDGTITRGRWADTPSSVIGLTSEVAAVSAGTSHTCALTTAGGIKCWGANRTGQLGDGTTADRTTPVDVAEFANEGAAVSAGGEHTCALTTRGGVKCWGSNRFGQLGDGTTADRTTPVDVSGLSSGVAAVSAGGAHTCALTNAGSVRCWGHNFHGQLGNGSRSTCGSPCDVAGLNGRVAAISAGGSHTCALIADGRVQCWGTNDRSQLGDGTARTVAEPVDVAGLATAVAISAGAESTCAVTVGGGLKCWGVRHVAMARSMGYATPVNVVYPIGEIRAVSAGLDGTCAVTERGGIFCLQIGGRFVIDPPAHVGSLASAVRLGPPDELLAGLNFTVSTTADAVDAQPGDGICDDGAGNCTLRAAVMESDWLPGTQVITVPEGTYTLTIAGIGEDAAATGDLDILDDLIIRGAGRGSTIIDGGYLDRVLHVAVGVTVIIAGVTIQHGAIEHTGSGSDGGGILNTGLLEVMDSTIRDSRANDGGGGGIHSAGRLVLTSVIISGNTALQGGGIRFLNDPDLYPVEGGGRFTMTDTVVSGNSATGLGGGINLTEGPAEIVDSRITRNHSGAAGGGIRIGRAPPFPEGPPVRIERADISGNTSGGGGGGINNWAPLSVTESVISNNSASSIGGGISNQGTLILTDSTVQYNTTTGSSGMAGGVVNGGEATISGTTIEGNSSSAGGAVDICMMSRGSRIFSPKLSISPAVVVPVCREP